jgi:hypothetical protein
VIGRVLHVERRTRPRGDAGTAERDELTVVTDAGDITTIEIGGSTRVRIADTDLRQDVARYLDIAGTNSDRSQRRVVLSTVGTGSRQLLVSYVGEAAVWKTTYRLIFPSAGDRPPTLQGWALVDNVSAADWENVELSLVAGAPQAFRQPLSAPLFATRPTVAVSTGPGLMPQTHAAALTGTARLSGAVRDESGSVLPGVTVIVSTGAQSDIARAVTNADGRFELSGLPPGVLQVRGELPGFKMTEPGQVTLTDGGTVQHNLTMEVASLQETVAVTGSHPSVPCHGRIPARRIFEPERQEDSAVDAPPCRRRPLQQRSSKNACSTSRGSAQPLERPDGIAPAAGGVAEEHQCPHARRRQPVGRGRWSVRGRGADRHPQAQRAPARELRGRPRRTGQHSRGREPEPRGPAARRQGRHHAGMRAAVAPKLHDTQ